MTILSGLCIMNLMTNLEIAELLRKVAAAYQILNENRFKIIAYDRAADSIEHLTSDAKDLWDDDKLKDVPGIGFAIAQHLDELFRTGKVKHFDEVMSKVPHGVFQLLLIPGIGPKKAYKLVKELNIKDSTKDVVAALESAAIAHKIAPIEGFGEKSEQDILEAINIYKKGQIKENRMSLPIADGIAQDVISHLKKIKLFEKVDFLGSLRRQVSTIGDIDIAVATNHPTEVIDHFIKYPHQKIVEQGKGGATLLLHNGRQVDMRVQKPEAYGAMLQYFTGSKHHNIKLRSLAQNHGLSLNEYGIKEVKTGKLHEFATEEGFYKALKMPWVPPELREDQGEIEASLKNNLPDLVKLADVKGDLHMHTNYDLESSHDLGVDTLADHLYQAATLNYEYIGLSDHNPSLSKHGQSQIVEIMKRRKEKYREMHEAWLKRAKQKVQIFVMCEVDILPDGKLALPEKAFEYVDAVIVSLHSSFVQPKKQMTERVIKALTSNPKVRIFGHPTGRLLGKREGVELDWGEIFAVCKKEQIALEINAYPDRLDLPDSIVMDAVKSGIKCCIDTDSHAVNQMTLMKYGVAVARRGWATKNDIVNYMGYNEFRKWLIKN